MLIDTHWFTRCVDEQAKLAVQRLEIVTDDTGLVIEADDTGQVAVADNPG